ncbi:NADPH:quinone reductase-like Zn-dependent oxidoreductase [Prosthecobacter fusiformis]|uniref:enoyl-[acyl-carrier-protein] reductase n=1 Tax=Prosthecobacter fusiformis TaxID=48464 RepID=A0A4R7RM43_9BACT|nr:2-enoyl thioester reductase domain-containing protein [Prosthecobacter fusiformis]TDU64563.1 NADPH:quinone reductase-like Zn-dependent oxidoreductase [Prosthecobacter fusiformis]
MSLCLSFSKTGNPADVLELIERPLAPLTGHEVRVHMRYAPINPADLNFIEGTYGRAAHPPAVPGHEACGEVEEVGPLVTSLQKGDVVIPLLGTGCWSQHLTAAELHFAKLPPGIDRVQAAMLRVNPVTAWHLLKKYVPVTEGEWVAQNAANSGVGRALIQIAKGLGIRTVNFVRRAELIPELLALGADFVFIDDEGGLAAAKQMLKDEKITLATNAVGGDSAIRLMDLLSPGGSLVTYGAMSRRSLKVPNKFLIFKNLQLHGLWISRWFEESGTAELAEVLEPLTKMVAHGEIVTAVDEIFPITDFRKAILRAQEGGRSGKVILDLA